MRRVLAVACACHAACFDKPPAPPAKIEHESVFVAQQANATFVAAAQHAGDAIVIHVSCLHAPFAADSFEIVAAGWTFVPLGSVAVTSGCCAGQSLAAIAPNVASTQFAANSTPMCPDGKTIVLGDEFSNTDPDVSTFGAAVAEGAAEAVAITTKFEDDAVWAAVSSTGTAIVGPQFLPGAGSNGNVAEYLLPDAPARTPETMSFSATSGPNVLTAVSIKPR
jgi:hypothetical protein